MLLKAVLRTITRPSPDSITLRLDASLKFKPGESVAVTFPDDPKKRYYSISSSPSEGKFVEITIKSEAGNPLTETLTKLKRGDELSVEGPFKSGLLLPDPLKTALCFIAAGTGITPFRSMVKYLLDQGLSFDLWLLQSAKKRDQLLFREDFSRWSGGNPRFHYVQTITQDFDDNWINETGRINDTMIQKHIPEKLMTYLICGPAEFVKDIQAMLTRLLNIPAENIRVEKW